MDAAALIAQIRSARLRWHDVEPGVRIQLDTPSALAVMRLSTLLQSIDERAIAEVAQLVRAWDGVTTRMLLGDGVGSDDVAPVAVEVASALLANRPEWLTALARAAIEQGTAAVAAARSISGN